MTHSYVVQTVQRAGDILVLTVVPKTGRDRLTFTAGQYAAIGVTRGGRPTPMRCFSITSTPSSGVLQFAMRVQGKFTRTIAELQAGDPVRVQGPFGEFTIDTDYDRKVVLLAGGIGITPFVGIMRDATERGLQIPITLLFSNRSVQNVPFYEELRALEQQNPNLRVRFYCADAAATVPGITPGAITERDIWELLRGEHAGSTYFVCGPKGFSDSMQKQLLSGGVHESRVLSETFSQGSAPVFESGVSVRSLTYGVATVALLAVTGIIMALDLARSVPRLASAQAAAQQSQSGVQASPQSSASDSNTSASGTTAVPVPTSSPAYQQPRYMYQPPMSSVS